MGKKEEKPDKGVFTWGAFTAIMIIVVCAAVLVFFFKVKLNEEPEKRVNENVINETMIDRGVIQGEDGNLIIIENTAEEPTTESPEPTEEIVEPAATGEIE